MLKLISPCLVLLLMAAAAGAQAQQQVWVVTDQAHPVTAVPTATKLIELDKTQGLENLLSHGLSTDQQTSADMVRSRLNPQVHRQLAAAYQNVVDAWALGIQKIPAVVVDRKYVIYGEANMERAISRIQRYRETQR